jgi:hypothetical protein
MSVEPWSELFRRNLFRASSSASSSPRREGIFGEVAPYRIQLTPDILMLLLKDAVGSNAQNDHFAANLTSS